MLVAWRITLICILFCSASEIHAFSLDRNPPGTMNPRDLHPGFDFSSWERDNNNHCTDAIDIEGDSNESEELNPLLHALQEQNNRIVSSFSTINQSLQKCWRSLENFSHSHEALSAKSQRLEANQVKQAQFLTQQFAQLHASIQVLQQNSNQEAAHQNSLFYQEHIDSLKNENALLRAQLEQVNRRILLSGMFRTHDTMTTSSSIVTPTPASVAQSNVNILSNFENPAETASTASSAENCNEVQFSPEMPPPLTFSWEVERNKISRFKPQQKLAELARFINYLLKDTTAKQKAELSCARLMQARQWLSLGNYQEAKQSFLHIDPELLHGLSMGQYKELKNKFEPSPSHNPTQENPKRLRR